MPRKKKRIATLDAETDPFEFNTDIAPFVWGFFDGENYVYFWGDDPREIAMELLDYLRDESDLVIYAHNGGKFDFHFLLEFLDDDLFIVNGRIAKATLFGGAIELRDSWMILPIPLRTYEKDDIEYWKMKKEHRHQYKNEIIRYLRKDCSALYDLVSAFVNEFGLNLTLAGTALKELKKTGYEVTRTYENYDEKLRPYYFGGRVQCFDVGSFYGGYEYVDINSAYPNAMLDSHWCGGGCIEHIRLPEKENGSWYAEILATPLGSLPHRQDNKLYFPDDETPRVYKASGWEINAGLESGTLKIHKVLSSKRPITVNNFSEYVSYWFEKKAAAKEAGDRISELFAKLMLNSCYGKFGQDGRKFEKFVMVPFGEWPENHPSWSEDRRWRFYADTESGHSLFSRSDPTDKFYNVATAASVTAHVRAYLWESIQKCEQPLYCDTDSIICKKFNGKVSKKLGDWDLEARFSEIHIAQRKMYAGRVENFSDYGPIDETKTASKGVRLTYSQIKRGVEKNENLIFDKQAPSFSLRFGTRYTSREIDFKNIQKNVENNPPKI